jgi:hypothetical protein
MVKFTHEIKIKEEEEEVTFRWWRYNFRFKADTSLFLRSFFVIGLHLVHIVEIVEIYSVYPLRKASSL